MAKNPVVPGVGMADPHVHVFDGKFYMYSTHDYSSNNTGFRMDDWRIWASDDLVSWQLAYTLDAAAFSWNKDPHECWATDALGNGTATYFYLSVGPTQIGVAVSTTGHAGPFHDPIGKPLIAAGQVATDSRDPAVFRDPRDNQVYLVFGTFDYFIARLSPDLISLAETPRPLEVLNAMGQYGPGKTDDKPFMHFYSGRYYLSWGAFYGTATSPHGPFTYAGPILDEASIAEDFRVGNASAEPWWTREDYADRHGSFFTHGGQWYFATNDRSHSGSSNPGGFRDTVIGYVHYYVNGSIAPIEINATGVGEYTGGHGACIQAENFFRMDAGHAARKLETLGLGGFHVAGLGISASPVGDHLHYPRVRGVPAGSTLRIWASNAGAAAAAVTARGRHRRGRHGHGREWHAVCTVPPTGSGHGAVFVAVDCAWAGHSAVAGLGGAADALDLRLSVLPVAGEVGLDRLEFVAPGAADAELLDAQWV